MCGVPGGEGVSKGHSEAIAEESCIRKQSIFEDNLKISYPPPVDSQGHRGQNHYSDKASGAGMLKGTPGKFFARASKRTIFFLALPFENKNAFANNAIVTSNGGGKKHESSDLVCKGRYSH